MTQVYTRSKTLYFPNGVSTNQLITEINNAITPPVLYINLQGDTLEFHFASQLSDESALDTILTNHSPQSNNYSTPYISDNIITNTINGTPYKYFGNNPFEITISKTSQSQYTSISEAIAANNSPNNVFIVSPGTYIENNPIVLPAGSSLRSNGTGANTFIIAQNPNSDLIVMGPQCSITGFTINGAKGVNARGVYFDATQTNGSGTFSVIAECFVVDCFTGVECDGKNFYGIVDTLYCDKIIIKAATQTLGKGVYIHSGGQFITTTSYVVGVPGYFPVLIGYYCSDPTSKISIIGGSAWFCGIGIQLENNCNSELSLLTLNYNNIGTLIGTNGSTTKLSANSLAINNSVTYDISVLATRANVEIYSSYVDDSKIYNPNHVNINIKYNATNYGNYYQAILGDLQIGSANQPSRLGIGEGLYINNGIFIFSNSNLESGTWIDNTVGALSYTVPSFNLFPTGAVGECMYIGSDYDIFGFKISMITCTSTMATLNDIVWEFWNGTTWVTFNVMQTYPSYPCHTYMNAFVSIVSVFNVRFGLSTNAPFVTKTLNGKTKKWIRYRIVNALSNVPSGEFVKIHTNSTVVNNDGYIEYFGNARIAKNFQITNIYPSNSTPTSNELFITQNVSIGLTNNVFASGSLTKLGFCDKIETDIDISFPLKLNLAFVTNDASTGDIVWTVRYGYTSAGFNVYLNSNDAPTSNTNIMSTQNIVTVNVNNNNTDLRTVIDIDIHNIPSNPSSSDKYILFMVLERDATNNNNLDTYPGNAVLMNMDLTFVSWCNGGHLLGF